MQSRKIVNFAADLAKLIAEHFGEPSPATEPRHSTHPDSPAAPAGASERVMSSTASALASVLADLAVELSQPRRVRGRDMAADLEIDHFQTGATVPLRIGARTVLVSVPLGVADGATLKLTAQGGAGDPPGDLYVRVRLRPPVQPDAPGGWQEYNNLMAFARELFARRDAAGAERRRGRDLEADLEIDFFQMMSGATVPLTIDARTVPITLPIGVVDGAILRLAAQGGAGEPAGDLHVRVRLRPHPDFERDGDHIKMRVPVSLEALAHERLKVEGPNGPLMLSITADHLGRTLRCEGEGIAPAGRVPGDLLIDLDPSPLLAAAIDDFPSAASAFDALRSLCPGAREHLTNLVHRARGRDLRDVVWALAVAHERGLRAPLRGLAHEIVDELVEHGSLRPSGYSPSSNRRSHAFARMGESPLVSREQRLGSSCLLWTVHLDRLADECHWSHAGAVVTHH